MAKQRQNLSGAEKAAILLVALGKENAASIFKGLRSEEIERLTLAISSLKQVSHEMTDTVNEEFHQMLLAEQYISEGGQDYARELLEEAMGAEKAEEIFTNLTGLNTLKEVDTAQLLEFMQHEHPQTIALLLAHLDRVHAAEILSGLPQDRQRSIMERIATMDKISPDMIRSVDEALDSLFESAFRRNMSTPGGPRAAAEIMNLTDRTTEKRVMLEMQKINRDLAAKIKDMMFVFEDILTLDEYDLQKVLQQVSVSDLSYALVVSTDDIKEFILNNVSARVRKGIEDDIEYMGAVKVREVEQAQRGIVDAVQSLVENGDIVVGRKEEIISPAGGSP